MQRLVGVGRTAAAADLQEGMNDIAGKYYNFRLATSQWWQFGLVCLLPEAAAPISGTSALVRACKNPHCLKGPS